MLLLVDAGNTRVKWALVEHQKPSSLVNALGQWQSSGMVEHAHISGLSSAWQTLGITQAILSNVAGSAMRNKLQHILIDILGMQQDALQWFVSSSSAAGLRNHYRNPAQLGCDRFASAIGAHALFPNQPLVVATCGTATTVDAISPEGDFLGGMILPGLGLMAASLAKNTAQLPQVAQDLMVSTPFANHTDAAIVSGCISAQVGAIERAVQAHRHAQEADENVLCVLSGGAGSLIAPHLSIFHQRVDNLVLIGLQVFAFT